MGAKRPKSLVMINSPTCFVQFSSVFELEMREFGFTNPQNYFNIAVLLGKLMNRVVYSVGQREIDDVSLSRLGTSAEEGLKVDLIDVNLKWLFKLEAERIEVDLVIRELVLGNHHLDALLVNNVVEGKFF